MPDPLCNLDGDALALLQHSKEAPDRVCLLTGGNGMHVQTVEDWMICPPLFSAWTIKQTWTIVNRKLRCQTLPPEKSARCPECTRAGSLAAPSGLVT